MNRFSDAFSEHQSSGDLQLGTVTGGTEIVTPLKMASSQVSLTALPNHTQSLVALPLHQTPWREPPQRVPLTNGTLLKTR